MQNCLLWKREEEGLHSNLKHLVLVLVKDWIQEKMDNWFDVIWYLLCSVLSARSNDGIDSNSCCAF